MISGYLALLHIKDDDTIFSYGYKRAIRLYPAYWTAIIVTSLTTAFFLPEKSRSIGEIIINFTMLQEFVGVASVDGVYWTLKLELIFYFFIGALILFRCKKHILKLSFLWILVLYAEYLLPSDGFLVKVIRILFMSGNGHIFVAGIAIYSICKNENRAEVLQSILLLFLCAVYSFLTSSVIEGCFFCAIVCIVILVTKINPPAVKVMAPLRFVSKISYPLYLVHQFVGFAIIYNMERIGLTSELFIIVPVAASALLAICIHEFVEIPVGKFLKKKKSPTL